VLLETRYIVLDQGREVAMKILLAVDGSPCSDLAIGEVARRVWPAKAFVHVVAVEAPVGPPPQGGKPTVFGEIVKQQRAEAVEHPSSVVETIRRLAPGLPRLPGRSPKDVIIGEAGRWGADLIVVGAHGYGPIRRFFLGSVTLYFAHPAP
jgi:nucleotide-binding universal stress UspA family protein